MLYARWGGASSFQLFKHSQTKLTVQSHSCALLSGEKDQLQQVYSQIHEAEPSRSCSADLPRRQQLRRTEHLDRLAEELWQARERPAFSASYTPAWNLEVLITPSHSKYSETLPGRWIEISSLIQCCGLGLRLHVNVREIVCAFPVPCCECGDRAGHSGLCPLCPEWAEEWCQPCPLLWQELLELEPGLCLPAFNCINRGVMQGCAGTLLPQPSRCPEKPMALALRHWAALGESCTLPWIDSCSRK